MLNENRPIRRPAIVVAAALAVALAVPLAAAAHQCVDVEILRAPEVAHPGELIHVEGWAQNCGDPARAFRLTWVLVDEIGDRQQLSSQAVQLAPGEAETAVVRLLLPRDLRPGHYGLVLVGQAPSGFTDRDAVRIAIRKRQPADDGP